MSDLGLKEVIAMGVGGMVSGGIYAVLGVAMHRAGNAVPISYIIAGVITLLTAYSYIKLTMHFGENGGAFSFIEHTVENKHIAGFFGWILVVGYIGMMAMYSFAFGSYVLIALREAVHVNFPHFMRPLISVGMIWTFVSLNVIGVKETGLYEDIAVYIKVLILLGLSFLGIYFFDGGFSAINFFNKGSISPVTSFAIIFVSYAGFQLIIYDYEEIENVTENLPKGLFAAILLAIMIYVSVSFMAVMYLSPEQIIQHKETALAAAVSHIPLLGKIGFTLVILSAIKSTSSGINATLFGSSRLAHRIATEKELPDVFSFRNKEGVPIYALFIMAVLTSFFAAFGSLEQITQFGSIAFIVADAAANYANLKLYDETGSNRLMPLLGLLGTLVALPLILYHMFKTQPHILVSVIGIFSVLLIAEFMFIERKEIEEEVREIEREAEIAGKEVEKEVEEKSELREKIKSIWEDLRQP